MTDLINMTKSAINALLATPLTASQLKKKSHADLVTLFDAMPAADALDADLRDARADDPTPPAAPTMVDEITGMTALKKERRCRAAGVWHGRERRGNRGRDVGRQYVRLGRVGHCQVPRHDHEASARRPRIVVGMDRHQRGKGKRRERR